MKAAIYFTVLCFVLFSCTSEPSKKTSDSVVEAEVQPSWKNTTTTKGFAQPESVAYDKKRKVFYVSNQNGEEPGFISVMSPKGKITSRDWVTGLGDPKGIEVVGDKLYVSDVTSLVEVDVETGKVLRSIPGPESKFLNDVAADADGNIYVSDMLTSAIYKLDLSGEFSIWMSGENLDFPNGLYIDGDNMYLASWGKIVDGNALEAAPGGVLKIDLNNKNLSKDSRVSFGNLDGIRPYEGGFIISDWINGAIYSYENGVHKKLFDTVRGSGDIAVEDGRLYIPMAMDDEVLIYEMK